MGSADLELVLEVLWPVIPGSGLEPTRHIGSVVKELVTALFAADARYVLAGTMAYGLYARARYTTIIEIIVPAEACELVLQIYADRGYEVTQIGEHRYGFQEPLAGAELHVVVATTPLEAWAVQDPTWHTIFGVRTPSIKPDYLMWLYSRSDRLQDYADAVTLAAEYPINAPALRSRLEANEISALPPLDRILIAAERAKKSSYSNSVAARLKQRSVLP